jgi:alanyl-tRNA synthetase
VDGARRRDHREQHHGQHLLSRAFVEAARARTVSFHLGAEVSSIDLDREVGDALVSAAEALANEVIWSARPVGVRTLSRAAAEALGLKVPPEAGDAVRVVDAQGFDAQPCGGTHPRNTAEVGCVVVVGKERYKAGSRIRFLCGHRVIDAFRARRGILDRLSEALSTPIDGLPEAVDRAAAQASELARQVKELREQTVGHEADRLAAAASGGPDPAVIVAVYDGWGPGELRALALAITARRQALVLLGGRSDKAYVALGQSDGLGHDLGPWLQQALQAVEGKGGGRGNLVQGAGSRTEALAPALDRLAETLRTSLGRR